jgi:hypothetical protein
MEIEEAEERIEEIQERRATKVIALYNHKGGVGKTTSTLNLGWKLASRGHKVLLVDADPQCNLTGFLVDPGCELKQAEDYADPLELFYERYPRANVRAALAPILGELREREELGVQQTGVLSECYQLCQRNEFLPVGGRRKGPFSKVPDSLYLLAGHPLFSDYDPKIELHDHLNDRP